jgi:hypothetical protein
VQPAPGGVVEAEDRRADPEALGVGAGRVALHVRQDHDVDLMGDLLDPGRGEVDEPTQGDRGAGRIRELLAQRPPAIEGHARRYPAAREFGG